MFNCYIRVRAGENNNSRTVIVALNRIVYATRHLYKYRATIGFDGGVPGEKPILLTSALPSPYVVATMLASKVALMLIVHATASISSMALGLAAALLAVNASVVAMTDPLLVGSFFSAPDDTKKTKSVSKATHTTKKHL